MSVSGHSGYGPDENAMSIKHWDKVKDLPADQKKSFRSPSPIPRIPPH